MNETLIAIISTLLTGGFILSIVAAYTAKKKVPVERDSIIVNGAETAVQALARSLEAETARADRLERELLDKDTLLSRKDERIAALEQRLDALQVALDAARTELHAILSAPLN